MYVQRTHKPIRPPSVVALLVSCCLPASVALAASPCLSGPVGLLGHAQSVKGSGVGIDVQGTFAYVGDWGPYSGVLQVFDVSNPCNPVRKGTVGTTNEIGDLTVFNNRAYVANDADGFTVFDVSNPNVLTRITGRSDGTYAHSVFVKDGRYAFVGHAQSPGRELAIYDLTAFPSQAPAIYAASQHESGADVFATVNRAYMVSFGPDFALDIVNVSDPLHPVLVKSMALPYSLYGDMGELRVAGNYVYLGMATRPYAQFVPGGLRVVDITDENNPSVIARFDIPGIGNIPWKGVGLAVDGNRAFLGGKGGLYVIDIADPTNPFQRNYFLLPAEWATASVMHVEIRGNLAYATVYKENPVAPTGPGGLAIFKIADQPPTANAGADQTVECASPSGVAVSLTGGGTDPEGGPVSFRWSGPFGTLDGQAIQPTLPLGIHTITLVVTDPAGSTASDTVQVTVRDSMPPTGSLTLAPNQLWPPNHRLVPISATLTISDACTVSPAVTLGSISSNEPDNGIADGDTAHDIQGAAFGTDDRVFLLRAERMGSGAGRMYTITYFITDSAGNRKQVTGVVRVPQDL